MRSDHELQERLAKGFYVRNLYEMASLCKTLAMDATHPLPFFVIRHLFLNIANDWEDRPLPVEEAKSLESRLKDLINEVIEAMEADAPPQEIYDLLNALVTDYLASPA